MKQLFKLTALLAAVLMLAACKPEPIEVERDIVYTVDEITTTVHLRTDAEFDALLEQFCDYAEDGSTVTFYNANHATKGTKDATHFSTSNREEMKRWMAQMEDAGKTVTVTYDPSTGTYNGMAYAAAPQPQNNNWVDLGLPSGLLWARCNIGATTPEEYGDYFAWGETQTKNVYSADNYIHCNGSLYRLTKYCYRADWGDNGYTDTLTRLEACDDAATAILGDGAYIPTREDWQELIANTVGEWVVTDVCGYGYWRFTAPNGNTLCLPASGQKSTNGYPYGIDYCGIYWTSDLDTSEFPLPWHFKFKYYGDEVIGGLSSEFSYSHRFMGNSLRAVRHAQ
jgi:hypothetical protein